MCFKIHKSATIFLVMSNQAKNFNSVLLFLTYKDRKQNNIKKNKRKKMNKKSLNKFFYILNNYLFLI